MADYWQPYAIGWHVPFIGSFAIAPSDTVQLAQPTRGIYVGGAGNITMELELDGAAVLWEAVPVGTVLSVRAILVKATGTTATNLVGLY